MTDDGIAAVVGALLMLAVGLTALTLVARADLPRYGEAAERAWDEELVAVANAITVAVSTLEPGRGEVLVPLPPPKTPEGIDIPLLGTLTPSAATGTVSWNPSCTILNATHTAWSGANVNDIVNGSAGCLSMKADHLYAIPTLYRIELGGLLRIQGDRAIVLAGPALTYSTANATEHRVSVVFPLVGGPAQTGSLHQGARADLVPGPHAAESSPSANAEAAVWTFHTAYPRAWSAWWETTLRAAGSLEDRPGATGGESPRDHRVECLPSNCAVGASGLGAVQVTIHGPRTDRNDLALSISTTSYVLALRG